ncbi:hypothetical protein [Falsihalocynthiibacter arcticus]|uniref:Glycosyltransferase RgtA/B/C/D-like domain-containing protein n=1 Tax=Falsihalocynthiibacter arcticus TaxID=1579316 RepID=A0A126UWQ6_9RHOB|nr:hypothetical protein [Falsihalocynthiibacter arcticus]AML50464.1 hypothetical protein RC74_03540 [Falsihalocynthiibacter arcticus]
MNRLVGHIIAFVALFLVLLATLAWAEANGFVASRVTTLWAKAIIEVDGASTFNATDAFFPPLPFMLTIALQWLTGGTSVPTPFLISAGLGTLTLIMWFGSLRFNGGVSAFTSYLAVALLALNPFFLRSLADGPENILTMIGTWIFARGIINLRLTGNAPDMMKVAVGLLIVSMSNSYGVLICLGAMPFMIVAARPSMLVASSTGYLIAMFYPVVAAALSLLFVSKIFNSSLVPLLTEDPIEISVWGHIIVLLGLTPIALVAIFRNIFIMRYFMPLIASFATILSAYFLNTFFHVEADPALAIAPMLAVVAVAIRHWPKFSLREPIIISLLALGLLLSTFSFRVGPEGETSAWVAAMQGKKLVNANLTKDVVTFLATKDGILVDIERNPEIVPAIGDMQKLIVSGQTVYDWALEGGILRANYVLVQNSANLAVVTDRILRRYPELLTDQLVQYKEVFQNARWRVFERTKP